MRNAVKDDRPTPAGWLLIGLIAVFSTFIGALLEARPLNGREVAAIYPPWWPQVAVISAAARVGSILTVGHAPFVVIVRTTRPDADALLRRTGALFSIDPRGLTGCGG